MGQHVVKVHLPRWANTSQHLTYGKCTRQLHDVIMGSMLEGMNEFPRGRYVSVKSVLYQLLRIRDIITTSALHCPNNHPCDQCPSDVQNCFLIVTRNFSSSAQQWLDSMETCASMKCHVCNSHLMRTFSFKNETTLLALDVTGAMVNPNYALCVIVGGEEFRYCLAGVIYFGDRHFVSRVITLDSQVWFHDGIATGSCMKYNSMLEHCELKTCKQKTASGYVYLLLP
jgi:hypothetical protein